MKKFNVTGLCVPEDHYMVDVSGKIAQIKGLVDNRCYFTINRARQYGKTTILNELKKSLDGEYLCVSTSFEGLGSESFSSSESFCHVFMSLIRKSLRFTSADMEYIKKWADKDVVSFEALSDHITAMCKDKKIVLIVDEVDKASNNQIFLHFLSILRSKFLDRQKGMDYTFHSVILAGVYDIKNIKLKMIQEGTYTPSGTENKIYNSPWNIAVAFKVDMSFNPDEIGSMLEVYEVDHQTGMSVESISKEVYTYTGGYPFLVSRICQIIDEELNKSWTYSGVQDAVQIFLDEKNTLFDDLFKNLENNKNLYELIYSILIVGEKRSYSIDNPTIDLGVVYGIIKNSKQGVIVSNRVFEIRICNYFISKDEEVNKLITGVLQSDVVRNGKFNMELCILKFAEHYAEIFNKSDTEFLERHGRLLFLSYLKPLINGQGFYHIESQLTDSRRMDIVVDFGNQQFIIELKIWRGQQYQSEAYMQLYKYLESKHAYEGYLLTFDFRKRDKSLGAEWVIVNDKRIFDVMV